MHELALRRRNESVLGTLKQNWWLMALRGVTGVAFGILAFTWPHITLIALIWLFGAFAFINGVLSLAVAMKAPEGYPRYGSLLLGGLLSLLIGLMTFVMPGITALGLLLLIATWALFTGIFEIAAAVRLRQEIRNEWLLVLVGIASIVFAFILVLQPAAGALLLIGWIGTYALIFGVLIFLLSFKLRRLPRKISAG